MGIFYKYKCNGCGFKKEFLIGGGFFSDEYFDESTRLEDELKKDSLEGKFGEIIKAMAAADTDGKLSYYCGTALYQCRDCKTISVHRDKRIGLEWRSNNIFDLDIDIRQNCPECGSADFKRIKNCEPLCPECKKEVLELVSIGNWD